LEQARELLWRGPGGQSGQLLLERSGPVVEASLVSLGSGEVRAGCRDALGRRGWCGDGSDIAGGDEVVNDELNLVV
jgi:hypothetical protein